jgi:putative hydrolase of the HAD superfamily
MDTLEAVFFDLDDTLFDASGLAEKARRASIEAMIEKGLTGITAQQGVEILNEIVAEFGSNSDQHFDMMLKRLDQYSSKLVAVSVITYHRIKVQEIRLFPDVFGFLQNIRNESAVQLGIISDGLPIKQWEKILRLGIDTFIPNVFISEEVGIKKPNPKLFSLAVEKVGVNPENSIYIGDRFDNDIVPAKQIGMHTCLVHRLGKYDRDLDDDAKALVDFECKDFKEFWRILQPYLKPKE